MMNINNSKYLEEPVIKEAKLIDRQKTIDYSDLKSEGATLVAQDERMVPGDRIQAWGISTPPYTETKIVPDRATSLSFQVPKAYLRNKRNVTFQYFLLGDDESIIAISPGANYAVTSLTPDILPAPIIEEADPDSMDVIVANLPTDGATILIDYPGIELYDKIEVLSNGGASNQYEQVLVYTGILPVTAKIPKAYFEKLIEDGRRAIVLSYSVVDADGNRIAPSRMQLYGVQ